MYKRALSVQKKSFFLFGPRGTGKSTWLRDSYPDALRIDLLKSSEYLKFKKDPSLLRQQIEALPSSIQWIILDEIQRLPELLNEVHSLIFDYPGRYLFALSGSSARKLKKTEANLLAGRALNKKLFPLISQEIGPEFNIEQALFSGTLPFIYRLPLEEAHEVLDSYIETYFKEEIQQEALVRNLDSFFKFLQVAALTNGQILNISSIARDAGVARSSVQGYFQILSDTLLGWFLPAFRPRAKIKEIAHPKFYLFDCGVQRALVNRHRHEIAPEERGHLFETLCLNEIRALNSYRNLGWEMSYWRTESGNEVDLILSRGSQRIGIEIKSNREWKQSYQSGLDTLLEEKTIQSAFGIFLGVRAQKSGEVQVIPFTNWMEKFAKNEI